MNRKKEEELAAEEEEQMIRRMKLPRGPRESLGILEQRLGASRLEVRCLDGKTRVCRIPGRLKRRLWVRKGDIVIVEAWEYGGDEKGDVIYKYKPIQVHALKEKGFLRKLEDLDEF
jgi:translation initiation factor 1A